MKQEWLELLARYAAPTANASGVFDQLVASYSAPERHYHNLEHLSEMFGVETRLAGHCDDLASVQLAIWFHDAVYDPRSKDNEARSAQLARESLAPLGVPRSTIDRVMQLVNATTHLTSADPPSDRDTAALLDADLAILGASEERYRRYAADIRKEYAFVPEEEYRRGRSEVLRKFLARSRIFHNRLLFEEAEARARINLARELAELSR